MKFANVRPAAGNELGREESHVGLGGLIKT